MNKTVKASFDYNRFRHAMYVELGSKLFRLSTLRHASTYIEFEYD